jgi:hypothetical protein
MYFKPIVNVVLSTRMVVVSLMLALRLSQTPQTPWPAQTAHLVPQLLTPPVSRTVCCPLRIGRMMASHTRYVSSCLMKLPFLCNCKCGGDDCASRQVRQHPPVNTFCALTSEARTYSHSNATELMTRGVVKQILSSFCLYFVSILFVFCVLSSIFYIYFLLGTQHVFAWSALF